MIPTSNFTPGLPIELRYGEFFASLMGHPRSTPRRSRGALEKYGGCGGPFRGPPRSNVNRLVRRGPPLRVLAIGPSHQVNVRRAYPLRDRAHLTRAKPEPV